MESVSSGVCVTRYEFRPIKGTRISDVEAIYDDIQLIYNGVDIRLEKQVPGKSVMALEIPNKKRRLVPLRGLLEKNKNGLIPNMGFVVGLDTDNEVVNASWKDIGGLMITGFTGAGKSVFVDTLLISTLYYSYVEKLKLILIDPKVVDLYNFRDLPQLAIPVVTDPRKGVATLEWLCEEMDNRHKHFIEWYKEDPGSKPVDIVLVIDEFADLMITDVGRTENALIRLLQMGKSVGIHTVLATQCTHSDVVSPLLHANCKTEIHFYQTGSRNIFMNSHGEESLMGFGDMLFFLNSWETPERIQGPSISSEEIDKVVNYFIEHYGRAQYDNQIEERIMQYEAELG